MIAFSEFYELFIYVLLGTLCILFFLLSLRSKRKKHKLPSGLISSLFLTAVVLFFVYQKINKRQMELKMAGTYDLTSYPNCDDCKITLKEDNTFNIFKKATTLEKGNWHFQSHGKYWYVYLSDDNKVVLGSGNYKYNTYELDRLHQTAF